MKKLQTFKKGETHEKGRKEIKTEYHLGSLGLKTKVHLPALGLNFQLSREETVHRHSASII